MTLGDATLSEKAAQLVFPRLGSNMPPPVEAAEDIERFEALLDDCPVGGLIVFNGSYPGTPEALRRLQQRSRRPLLVCADIERGVGQQIRGATLFPHARAYAAAGDEALLEEAARAQAREALACGIHVTFSPVADVNRDPRNPIIATRAFGSDPQEAARFVRAFVHGSHREGLLTTAKHFPGHGNTSQDSHSELPVVESSREELERFDLVPFRAAVEAGVDLVMTAHVRYPSLDPDRPATLSPAILRGLLREELGFDGAVVTDSLLMGAIRASHPTPGEQAAALVGAGVDILLDFQDPREAVEGIVRAVEDRRLEERRVDEAANRVLSLKARLTGRHGADIFVASSSIYDPAAVGSAKTGNLARKVARAAIEVLDDPRGILPLHAGDARGDILALLIKPHGSRLDPDEEPFGRAFREAFPGMTFRQAGPEASPDAIEDIRREALRSRMVVLALVVKPAAWHAFGLLPEQKALVDELVESIPTVVVSLGSPYVLDDYPGAHARLCAYSDVEVSQQAVIDFLRGT